MKSLRSIRQGVLERLIFELLKTTSTFKKCLQTLCILFILTEDLWKVGDLTLIIG